MGRYYINTYGCQMNVHESEKLAGILEKRGYQKALSNDDADVIVFNTCCIRQTAENRIVGNIGNIKKIKERKPSVIVAVCGCMTQKSGTADSLVKKFPFINIVFGTHNLYKFGEYLDSRPMKGSLIEVWEQEERVLHEDVPVYRTSGVNAWVNIMYGCNNFCSYCIVPYVRGRERSREKSYILNDVKSLVLEGYKEITLLGQNVNSYGNDIGKNEAFADLLSEVSQIDGDFRIKFMTSHPKDLSEDVVKIISQSDKLANFIHLPVQAGSDRILSLMNRKYTSSEYLKKIDTIRKYIPNAGLSSDIMVGFPTETDQDYLDTVSLVEKVRYNNLYTFIYSRRSGTPADKMEQVEHSVKKERIKKLIDLQFSIGNEIALASVGDTYKVLCDTFEKGRAKGKSSCGKSIYFKSENDVCGQFVDVKITGNKNNELIGEMV